MVKSSYLALGMRRGLGIVRKLVVSFLGNGDEGVGIAWKLPYLTLSWERSTGDRLGSYLTLVMETRDLG